MKRRVKVCEDEDDDDDDDDDGNEGVLVVPEHEAFIS